MATDGWNDGGAGESLYLRPFGNIELTGFTEVAEGAWQPEQNDDFDAGFSPENVSKHANVDHGDAPADGGCRA